MELPTNQKTRNFHFAEEKKKRFTYIISLLSQAKMEGKEIALDKLVAEICFSWGLTKKKVTEYINVLTDSGRIEVKEGVVTLK